MAPKNNAKGGDKKGAAAKGKGKDAGNDDKSKVKGAQSINVRHILVSSSHYLWIYFTSLPR
jgi:NIMA-interacting peptidyl-prolyl cis-trans isomerase 4